MSERSFSIYLIGFISVFALIIVTSVGTCVYDSGKVETTIGHTVISKISQPQISKDGTRYRYLVITDKETFRCESSLLNGKFNNSDVFYRLKENYIYDFKVCGVGKTFATDYRNILQVLRVDSMPSGYQYPERF